MLEFIAKYWVEWLCGLVAGGVVFLAKHYVKLQKKSFETDWRRHEEEAKKEVLHQMQDELRQEVIRSENEDKKIEAEIEVLSVSLENLNTGVLSIQGKQFRDTCLMLLEPTHVITVQEYEQFEEDYVAYKALGGNHRGDALHDRVVDKFSKQLG